MEPFPVADNRSRIEDEEDSDSKMENLPMLKDFIAYSKIYREQDLPKIFAQALFSTFLSLLLHIHLVDRSGEGKHARALIHRLNDVVRRSNLTKFEWREKWLRGSQGSTDEAIALIVPAFAAHDLLPKLPLKEGEKSKTDFLEELRGNKEQNGNDGEDGRDLDSLHRTVHA